MVRLSQSWIMRYPLIDWHGNNGNIAGDGPAASRYTESRLAKISEDGLLAGIKKRNVDFIPNYSEDAEEPVTLPSIFPNLLCNPNSGIGVAMACNWLPHNLSEVATAIFDYMDNKEPILPGPDFPTGGIVINKNDIPNIMKTGHGSVKVRGKYKIEKQNIVFYEIPYGTTIEDLLDEIGEVCGGEKKEIDGVTEVRDESNKKGLRIVIQCSKDANLESIANQLFMKTSLQTSISYNQVALIDKTPTELNLSDCIKIYIEHNKDCLIRETQFDLDKAEARKEIVDGLLRALLSIDEIIAFIKASESSAVAKDGLIKTYGFTENQVKAILAMRLSSLAKLESVELNQERAELENNIEEWHKIIRDQDRQIQIIRERLSALVKKYGDVRRTELAQIETPKEEKIVEEIIPEDVVVIFSQSSDIKRVPRKSFKVQRKNGKGIKSEDDAILATISTNTVDTLMLFTSKGRMLRLYVDNVPAGTNTSKGAKVSTLISLDADERVIAITSLYRDSNAKYVVFFTKNGMIKKTKLEEYMQLKKNTGIIAIKLKEGDSLANVTFLNEEEVIVITKKGMAIHFPTDDISPIGRVTAGVRSMKLGPEDEVLIGLPIHKKTDNLAIFTERGSGKKISLEEVPFQLRGGKGVAVSSTSIAGAAMIDNNDDILLVGLPNSICVSATDIPLMSRVSSGNAMIKNSKIMSVVKL